MSRRFYTLDVFAKERSPAIRSPSSWTPKVCATPDAAHRARVQPVGNRVRASAQPDHHGAHPHFHARRRTAFAGHPTVGTAVLLAGLRAPEHAGGADLSVVLEEEVGDVQCTVRLARRARATPISDLPRLPEMIRRRGPALAAAALSLDHAGHRFRSPSSRRRLFRQARLLLRAGCERCGYRTRKTASRSSASAVAGGPRRLLHARDQRSDNAVHARMFGAGSVIRKILRPAACAAFAGVAMEFNRRRLAHAGYRARL